MKNIKLILASGSPRRRELLHQIGLDSEIIPSTVEEIITSTEPDQVVMSLSEQKAMDVAEHSPVGSVVIGADTVVAAAGQILGKPESHEGAYEMIRHLQDDVHQVYTGVTLVLKQADGYRQVTFAQKTDVVVYPMSDEEIRAYADSEEPMDKAGAYGIQGSFAAYIQEIRGDYNNVVGLPVGRVYQELKNLLEDMEEEKHD